MLGRIHLFWWTESHVSHGLCEHFRYYDYLGLVYYQGLGDQ